MPDELEQPTDATAEHGTEAEDTGRQADPDPLPDDLAGVDADIEKAKDAAKSALPQDLSPE
jgi:hypothetical protein